MTYTFGQLCRTVLLHLYMFCVCYRTHMQDMQEVTQEVHYENYRHQKLASGPSDVKSPTSTPRQTRFPLQNSAALVTFFWQLFDMHRLYDSHYVFSCLWLN